MAEIVNALYAVSEDLSKVARPTDVSEVYEWFQDSEPCCVVLVGDRVAGFSFMYELQSYTYLWIVVDPRNAMHTNINVVEKILDWSIAMRMRKGFRKPLRIGGDLEHDYKYNLLKKVLTGFVEDHSATLMKLKCDAVAQTVVVPHGYRLRRGGVEDYRVVAEIFNEAFSQYPWCRSWSEDDVRRYLERRRPILFIAETIDGEPAGFIDGYVYRALDGGISGYIYTLAVKKMHRGRGLGKALLKALVEELIRNGVNSNRIFLDSVVGLEPLYRRLGFVDVRRYIVFKLIH